MSASGEVVDLPSGGRGYWILVAVGLGLSALGLLAGTGGDLVITAILLGAGVFLASLGPMLAVTNRPPAHLRVGARSVTIVERNGDEVELPWAALRAVELVPSQQSSGSHNLTLCKRDGGVIELHAFRRREEGVAIAAGLQRALDAAREAETEGEAADHEASPPRVHEPTTDAIPGVELRRHGDLVVLEWSGRASATRLLALGPIGGLGIIFGGMLAIEPSVGLALGTAFLGLLAVLVVGSFAYTFGLRNRLTIDGKHLTVERLRGDRVAGRTEVPIFAVVTVDYSDRLNVHGEGLTIRTGAGRDAREAAVEDLGQASELLRGELDPTSAMPDPIALGTAIMKLVSSGVRVELGRLSRAACIALDLRISAEVARRAGKSPGTV